MADNARIFESQRMTREIIPLLAARLREILSNTDQMLFTQLEEIRLRIGKPLTLICSSGEFFLDAGGKAVSVPSKAVEVTGDDLERTIQIITKSSLYAVEHEVRNGFLSVPGGHRVGICGTVVTENGIIKTIRNISSVNFRITRQVLGASSSVLKDVIARGSLLDTLLISPPQAGKTTLLRDIVRVVSNGDPVLGIKPHKVGVVDERCEIAACSDGIPQNDVGIRTDVMDSCPKHEGILMLLRSMSPDVVATDEIGSPSDAAALGEAQKAGVVVLATAHGHSLDDLLRRKSFSAIVSEDVFKRYVVLSRRDGPGTIEAVLDSSGRQIRGNGGDCRGSGDKAAGNIPGFHQLLHNRAPGGIPLGAEA